MDNLRFISPFNLNLRKTNRTNYVSSYPSYWNPSKTDGQNIVIEIYARQTNYVSFHSAYRDPRQTDRQTKVNFIPHIGIKVRQADKLFSPLIFESTQERQTNNISFHPSCWRLRQQTDKLRFIPLLMLTSKPHFISYLILESKHFRPTILYEDQRKKDRQPNYVSFQPLYWNPSKTNGHTTFHFTPNIGIQAR